MPQKVSEKHRKYSSYFASLLKKTQKTFCEELDVEEGIALNNALTENLFVTIVCILNRFCIFIDLFLFPKDFQNNDFFDSIHRVPVFLVGKPGTSKTLTLQIISSNLQGQQSPNPYWKRFEISPLFYLLSLLFYSDLFIPFFQISFCICVSLSMQSYE